MGKKYWFGNLDGGYDILIFVPFQFFFNSYLLGNFSYKISKTLNYKIKRNRGKKGQPQ